MNEHAQASFGMATGDLDPQWYALTVPPQKEYVVAYLLRKRGMATFIPTEIRTHKRSGYSKGKAEFAVPIIPGVVFAGFPTQPAWYYLLRNELIWGVIGMDGRPWRLNIWKLLKFFGGVHDGCMVFDGGLRLIHIPGRPPVRSLTTRTRTISKKRREATRPRVVDDGGPRVEAPKPHHTDFLSRFVHGALV